MKIMVVGNANDNYVQEFIEYVLIDGDHQIWMASSTDGSAYQDFYRKNNIHVIGPRLNLRILNGIPILSKAAQVIWKYAYFLKKYDVIHILNVHRYKFTRFFALLKPRIIYSYFGSELLRKNKDELEKQRKALKKASAITLATKDMVAHFREVYADGFDDRIHIVKYGVSGFDAIDRVLASEGKEACKRFFSIETGKTVISVGYNREPAQQHLEVLKRLSMLTESERKKIHIVLQMTYGSPSESYMTSVESAVNGLGCTHSIFSDFMLADDVARLRVATDIFIHAQVSDAFSATVQEYLYCGTAVINPVWIKYNEIKERGIYYMEYSAFNELPGIVSAMLSADLPLNACNAEKLRSLSAWTSVSDQWRKLYISK